MARLIKRGPTVLIASLVILVMAAIVAGVATAHPAGWFSAPLREVGHTPHTAGSRVPALPSAATSQTQRNPTLPAVHLLTQDLTPSTKLNVTATGFLSREPLVVTIQDAQGHTYEQSTLTAGDDGRLRATALALPPQLASGTYVLQIAGSTSHRTATVTFRMHDTPPTVLLDAYTSTPGQVVGFSGSGLIPGEEVLVYLGNATTPLVQAKATAMGMVSGRLTVPALVPGTYTLTIVGSTSQTPVSVGFNIQGYAPWVVLDRYAPTVGQGVGFIGQGFAPNEPVLVYLNVARGTPALSVTADPSGRIVAQDTWIPSGASGRNVLIFVGQWSKASTSAEFTVLAAAQPTPTSATAP